ncbi:MAG: alpha-amylase family glycosyl hydrolase [Fidelibacterota bacterium]
MNKLAISALFLLVFTFGQSVYWVPEYPVQGQTVSIYYDVVTGTLPDNAAQVFIHRGTNGWNNVVDDPMTYTGSGGWWQYDYFIPADVTVIDFVFQDGQGNWDNNGGVGIDWHIPVFQEGISAVFITPAIDVSLGHPLRSPVFLGENDSLSVMGTAVVDNTALDTLVLSLDGMMVGATAEDTLAVILEASDMGFGSHEISLTAIDTLGVSDVVTFAVMVNPPVGEGLPPGGNLEPGIFYNGPTTVTLKLFAPYKEFVYVIGDFNDWKVDTGYYMQRYQPNDDSTLWWLTLENISVGSEQAFQYLVDGTLRIADPYTDKVLDPWNDPWIPDITYPGLKSYPQGKTREPVSVLQTAQDPFEWQHSDTFIPPPQTDLIIYEMLVRDFIGRHDFQTLVDTLDYLQRLGINAIELMPINEFEGNSSWGYNPSFYFAPDKYYGPKNTLKTFIDACHARGIAVIQDIVFNHSFGQSPLVRLYWENGAPAANNPWYNVESPNPVYNWGYDFDHTSPHTQYFMDRVLSYWLTEYNVDGFRFDFSKGMTNTPGDGWNYDAARITLLKRMADQVWATDSTAYIILEHFTANSEETELAHYGKGMMLWGNFNYNYNEATMGYNGSGSDFSWGFYGSRGWTKPNLVTYMESHDEERLMFKNLEYGNASGAYDIQELPTALERMKLAGAFFFTLPGPKMIWEFGERGYDVSIDAYGGRLSEKPPRWEYMNDPNRLRLFNTWKALLQLRRNYDIFRSANTNVDLWLNSSTGQKRIRLSHPTMNAIIVGNFGIVSHAIGPDFHHTGTWYDYFSGDSITVVATTDLVTLLPGEFHIYTDVRLATPEQGLLPVQEESIPYRFHVSQNYPNPFNPETDISFTLPNAGPFEVKIFDITGREVFRSRAAGQSGPNRFHWKGRDQSGHHLPSGLYFARVQAGQDTQTIKMTLLR